MRRLRLDADDPQTATEPPPTPAAAPAGPDLTEIAARRRRLWAQGWRPIAVLTGKKRPLGRGWQIAARQEPPEAAMLPATAGAASTGVLCDGLRALDLDIDQPAIAEQVAALAVEMLGPAPVRSRPDSPRCLLLYRAAEGSPPKRVLSGLHGTIEVLGHGQQFVAFGQHPDGARYQWAPAPLDDVPLADVPAVSEAAITTFLAAVAPVIGAGINPFGPGPDGTAPDDDLFFDTGDRPPPLDHAAAEDAIAAGNGSHDAALRLAGSLAAEDLDAAEIEERLRAAYERRPAAARDAGWQQAVTDIPRTAAWAAGKEAQKPHAAGTTATAGATSTDALWQRPDLSVLDPRRPAPVAPFSVLHALPVLQESADE